jgi:ketosteroid isomerase-like protein
MAIDPMPDPVAASATTDPARIRELMLANLFAVFNERDPERRLEAIARNYTEDVTWTDPDGTTQGHEALNEQAQKLLDRMPGFVFSAAGQVHVSRDLGLLTFNLGMPEQTPAVSGVDVALVRDGRIAVLHTLLTAEG